MGELFKIVLTAAVTLIGGIVLLIFSRIFVEPIQELLKIIKEIAHHTFNSHGLLTNEPNPDQNRLNETTDRFKELSAKLRSTVNVVPWLPLFSLCRLLPPKKNILSAAECLSQISYAPSEDDKAKVTKLIEKLYELLQLDMHSQKNL